MRQQARKKTLIINGLIQQDEENVENTVMQLCKEKLHVNLHPVDIDSIIRLKPVVKRKTGQGQNGKNHNLKGDILLTVTTHRKKQEICRAKSKLKNCDEKIYINESLMISQGKLYAESRDMVKKKMLTSTWTRDGRIYVKEKVESSPKMISSKVDLDRYNKKNSTPSKRNQMMPKINQLNRNK
jgi:hypothetical protein